MLRCRQVNKKEQMPCYKVYYKKANQEEFLVRLKFEKNTFFVC